MGRFQHLKSWYATAQGAMEAGATVTRPNVLEHDVAGRCQRPVYREYLGAETAPEICNATEFYSPSRSLRAKLKPRQRGPEHRIEYQVRCRKCDNCRKARAYYWAGLMQQELLLARRSWMWTLTVHPERRYIAECEARLHAERRGHRWPEMADEQRFSATVKVLYREVQLSFKRLRKAGWALRYVAIAEPHRDGFPHLHVLVHEWGDPMHETAEGYCATLESQWPLGHSFTKLICQRDPVTKRPVGPPLGGFNPDRATSARVARYVAKYLSKSLGAKIRNSTRYGDPLGSIERHPEDALKA